MVYDCIEDGAIEAGDLLVHLYPLDADRTGFAQLVDRDDISRHGFTNVVGQPLV